MTTKVILYLYEHDVRVTVYDDTNKIEQTSIIKREQKIVEFTIFKGLSQIKFEEINK